MKKIKKLAVLLLMISVFTMAFGETATPVAANGISSGDVVINEIMQNPDAVTDANGEWFELYNATADAINLENCLISDSGSNSHTIENSLIIPAGDYIILAKNDDFSINGGVNIDYKYSNFTLGNSDDEIILTCNEIEIDKVEYDGGPEFPDPNGYSMILADSSLDNNIGSNWCVSISSYGDGDLGTPGIQNDSCGEEQCDDTDEDGICDDVDNCPNTPNPGQEDADEDGVGDACDNCPETANPGQEDADENEIGDVCESVEDTTPPVRDNGLPTGELAAGTTETTLSLTTDENATCKYSTTAETEYSEMADTFSTTGEMSHSTSITGLENGNDCTYYVRCQDELENSNVDDYEISFSVASPQSSGGSGGSTPRSVSSSNKPLTVLSFQEGTLDQNLNNGNKVKVEIPKGSVKSKTTFTASEGSLLNGDVPKNKVGAFLFNGLVFNIEAVDLKGNIVRDFSEDITITLTIPNLPDDISALKLHYFDDKSGEWIIITDIEFGDNTITFKVNHLTQFAVFEIPNPAVKGASDVVLFDGDVIRNPGAQGMAQFDVYVVKIIGDKKFKRLILNPDIFESYGHLNWENVKLVDQTVMNSFALSNLARCGKNVGVDSFKVYRLIPKNDAGTKQHFNITAPEFEAKRYDWDSVYIINSVDMNVYIPGPDII